MLGLPTDGLIYLFFLHFLLHWSHTYTHIWNIYVEVKGQLRGVRIFYFYHVGPGPGGTCHIYSWSIFLTLISCFEWGFVILLWLFHHLLGSGWFSKLFLFFLLLCIFLFVVLQINFSYNGLNLRRFILVHCCF